MHAISIIEVTLFHRANRHISGAWRLRRHQDEIARLAFCVNMDAADVIRLEATWKGRLHTRSPEGLNDN